MHFVRCVLYMHMCGWCRKLDLPANVAQNTIPAKPLEVKQGC